jgi:hypothetical protein
VASGIEDTHRSDSKTAIWLDRYNGITSGEKVDGADDGTQNVGGHDRIDRLAPILRVSHEPKGGRMIDFKGPSGIRCGSSGIETPKPPRVWISQRRIVSVDDQCAVRTMLTANFDAIGAHGPSGIAVDDPVLGKLMTLHSKSKRYHHETPCQRDTPVV